MDQAPLARIDQPEPPDIEHPGMPLPPDSPEIRPSRREQGVEQPGDPAIDLPEPPEVDEPGRREEERPDPDRPAPPGGEAV